MQPSTSVVAVRVADDIIKAIDAIADATPGFGRRVTRADIVRRALAREATEHAPAAPPARTRSRPR